MSSHQDILDDIISHLDPEDIPPEYIIMARITDLDGNERVLRGEELVAFLENPMEVAISAQIILDVRRIRKAIVDMVNSVYDEVNLRFRGYV